MIKSAYEEGGQGDGEAAEDAGTKDISTEGDIFTEVDTDEGGKEGDEKEACEATEHEGVEGTCESGDDGSEAWADHDGDDHGGEGEWDGEG